jgi:hypothetical protein
MTPGIELLMLFWRSDLVGGVAGSSVEARGGVAMVPRVSGLKAVGTMAMRIQLAVQDSNGRINNQRRVRCGKSKVQQYQLPGNWIQSAGSKTGPGAASDLVDRRAGLLSKSEAGQGSRILDARGSVHLCKAAEGCNAICSRWHHEG